MINAKSKAERVQKWLNHFQNLLGKEPSVEGEFNVQTVLQNLDISDSMFTLNEYQEAKKDLIDRKACGPDGITSELLKYCNVDEIMLKFCNSLLNGEKPDQWSECDLKPLPKSGDLSKTDNYRGIALSSIPAKLVNRMILNRIQPKIDPHLRPNQNGFRPGRSTVSHILALRRLLEGVRSHNLKAIITFVDFKKAFDSIHRERMMKILKAYGIPPKLVDAIDLMYQNTRAKIVTPDGNTEYFSIVAGVLQGDTLAPYLFAIVLDYVMREAIQGKEEELGFVLERKRSRRHPPIIVTDMDFADDIALVTEEIHQAQQMLMNLENAAAKVGLHLNAKKTEAFSHNQTDSDPLISKEGSTIKIVDDFKYLGSWLDSSFHDFEIRKALAWTACHRLSKVWKSDLQRSVKKRLFLATVESVLLYGCEAWTVDKTFQKRLDGCYTRMLRTVFNIHWSDKVTNKELYGDISPVSTKVAMRRLKLAGHLVRHPEEVASNLVLWQPTSGTRKQGRQKKTYTDTLLDDTDLQDIKELKSLMLDRDMWRKHTKLL